MRRIELTAPTLAVLAFLLTSCLLASTAAGVRGDDDYAVDDNASEDFDDDDEDLLRQIEAQHVQREFEKEDQMARELAAKIAAEHYNFPEDIENAPRLVDPCKGVRCGAGRICQADGAESKCVCIPECPEEIDTRRKVCTNFNETWESACEVHRQRCLCNMDDPQCRGEEVKHVHIDYYGRCRNMPDCSENDLADFPRRMRDWLFNVMRDLAARNELPEAYMELEHEAETNMTKRWTNAAIWKWCDLDGHPNDNSVSRHELFPIRAPLMALEHCIAPFLESCDPNNDHRITLQEWGNCLELEEDDLTARCAKINKEDEYEKLDLALAQA